MDRLSAEAITKVSGPSWRPLRETFLDLSETLLSVDPQAVGELTTIYVKYLVPTGSERIVYAVAWIKNSKSITVGFALPEECDARELTAPPAGMKYPGLTRYLCVQPGDSLPAALKVWANAAHDHALSRQKSS